MNILKGVAVWRSC